MAKEVNAHFRKALTKRIVELCEPKTPIKTGVTLRVQPLANIKAVFFDVYGTMLISGTEPLQREDNEKVAQLMEESFASLGSTITPTMAKEVARLLSEKISASHQKQKEKGINYPEVDILEIWRQILEELSASGYGLTIQPEEIPLLVVEFVIRYDEPWLMPGLTQTLSQLKEKNIELGIISNSQFYSPLTIEALTGKTLQELGFAPESCFWSYKEQLAKPAVELYERAADYLRYKKHIQPQEMLYVGNDMIKDIWAAQKVGCKTALFAGDKRSLRWRKDDVRASELSPSLIITELLQIPECLE